MHFWIDDILVGIEDNYKTNNIYELYEILEIEIRKLDSKNVLLGGNESFYYRDFLNQEIVFIRNDLPVNSEKFILAHELGHALLHTKIYEAAFNKNLLNIGKYEKQANYFALKLLKIEFDEITFREMTIEQIASSLEVPYETLQQLILQKENS